MKNLLYFFFLVFSFNVGSLHAQHESAHAGMDNKIMEKLLKETVEFMEGEAGNWQMIYRERLVFVLTDEANNRMRIFSPFIETDSLETEEKDQLLVANFHSALDAKYCIYEGLVMSVFTHPLRELTREQLLDALLQVVTLADNFRGSFSSTDLIFSPGNLEEEEAKDLEEQEKKKRLNKKPGKGKS